MGRPLGAGLQELASNHHKLLWPKTMVMSVEEKTLLRSEHNISGSQNKDLTGRLHKDGRQVSGLLKRLRWHGMTKKVGHCYKYYLTALGRRVVATAVRIREMTIIPSLCAAMVECNNILSSFCIQFQ